MNAHEVANGSKHTTNTRSGVARTADEDATVSAGTSASGRSQTHDEPGSPLLAGLIEFIARLLSAHIPEVIGGVRKTVGLFLHPQRTDGDTAVHQRIVDAGTRVVAWGKQHPGQAVAAGAAVVTVAVLIGVLVRRDSAATGQSKRSASSRRTTKRSKHQKA